MASVATTTTAPGATAAPESYLDPNVILSLSIGAMAMHTLAEFLGADVMGYATLQIGIAVASRACATGPMQSTFDLAAHVLSPARYWNDESSEVPVAGPAVVFLASLVAHYLIAALCGLCTYACCPEPGEEENDDGGDDERGEAGDGRAPPDPYGGGCWKLGSRMMRWPFWSVTLVRLNIVPCTVFAILQLGRGNQAPEGSDKEEVSQGVAASGAVLSTAVMIVLIGSIIITHRFVERMRPKWIFYGGSGNPERRDVGMLPCNGLLLTDGFWSDHGNGHIAGAAVDGAARGQGNVIACCVMAPIIALITAAFIGGPWELVHGKDSDTCVTPFAVAFGLLTLCGLMPVVLLRPYRHAGTNLMSALRLLALCLFLLTRIVPDDAVPQGAFTGIFFGTEIVTSFVTMVTGLLERLLWRPAEAEVRTVRLRYLMIVGRVMRAIDQRFGAGTPEAGAAKRAVPNMPLRDLRAGQYLDEQAIADVDMVLWREGDAPNELAGPQQQPGQQAPEGAVQLARRNSALLTVPVAAAGDNAGATRQLPRANSTTINPLNNSQTASPAREGSLPPPPIVFSPTSPHPLPRRELEESAGSPGTADGGGASSRRSPSAPPRRPSPLPNDVASPLPGGANPEAESLFLEMDILTAAISRFPSEPAPATAALIRDPFSVSASPRGEGAEAPPAAAAGGGGSPPLRATRSVRFGSADAAPVDAGDETMGGSSSILDASLYPAAPNGRGDEAPTAATGGGGGGGAQPPITFMQPQSRGGSLRVARQDEDDDPDL